MLPQSWKIIIIVHLSVNIERYIIPW